MATVLVVDDEPEIVEILRDYLEADGFQVRTATDGAAALAALTIGPVDCLLLDIMMPGASGFEVCRQIRATSDVPVLFLSARDGDSDKLRGLGLGDDYMVKSASPAEVLARVKAVLRRARPPAADQATGVLNFGRLVVDSLAHEVRVGGHPVPMTARELALLRVLAEHPRQVFSRDQLFELIWGDYGDQSTVWVHIRRLREKIEENPAQPRLIVTIWGIGYRFEGHASMKRRPASLPIRLCIGLIFGLIVAVPVLTASGLFATASWWQQQTKASALVAAKRFLDAGAGHWGDPAWQRGARRTLADLGVDALLFSPDGSRLFATAPVLPRDPVSRHAWEIEKACIGGGAPARGACGTAALFVSVLSGTAVVAASLAAGLLALLPTLAGVAWFLRRTVVRPLMAMSSAAQRIGDGRIDIQLPSSRIRELAAVAVALEGMSAGLQAALGRQTKLEQERRLFIGAVAHDLRTPLFTLRAYLDGLGDGLATTPEKASRYIAVCQDKAASLERLIADLFTYAQVEYLEQEPRLAPLDLGSLLHGLVETFTPRATARGIALVAVAPPGPCHCHGDGHLLTRAVENLLDNALRYTPPGGQVAVRWGQADGGQFFAVEDTGSGLAAQDLPHLFTPLFRGEGSRNRQTGGAGLGLAIARRILRAHGGDLTAANGTHGGATFVATLPATQGGTQRPEGAQQPSSV